MKRFLLLPLLFAAVVRADDTPSFFNGKDLDQFEGLIKEYWSVKDGAIVGKTEKLSFNTFLCSKNKYKDFELSFQVRLINGNSGVQVRSEIFNRDGFRVKGPQCDMGAQYWGSLYGENFGGMMKAADKDAVKRVVKEKEFNDYSIKVVGKKVTIKINGETMVDQEFDKLPESGIIVFQLHVGPPMEITFRNIKFTNLSK